MAIRSIRRQATNPLAAPGTPTTAPIYVDSDDNILKMIPAGSGTTEVQVIDASTVQTLTNKTLTAPVITGALVTSAPVSAAGANLTVTAALHAGKTIALNQASGTAVQLPAATGTGNVYRFVVTVASNANVISAVVATDIFAGGYGQNDTGGSAAVTWDFIEAAATDNTYSPTTLGGGGLIGDWIEFQDVIATTWAVRGVNKGTIDPTTRFSHV